MRFKVLDNIKRPIIKSHCSAQSVWIELAKKNEGDLSCAISQSSVVAFKLSDDITEVDSDSKHLRGVF